MPTLASLIAEAEEVTTDEDRQINIRRFRHPHLGEYVAGRCPDCKGKGAVVSPSYPCTPYLFDPCTTCDSTGTAVFSCKPDLD